MTDPKPLSEMELVELERLADSATPGPWTACREGKCRCGQVWSADAPVLEVVRGEWGDTYPSMRPIGNGIEGKFEVYIEKIVYGNVSDEAATATAAYVSAANPDIIKRLISMARK